MHCRQCLVIILLFLLLLPIINAEQVDSKHDNQHQQRTIPASPSDIETYSITPDTSSSSFQHILNSATQGSTIYVNPGIYTEQLHIKQSITLIGTDPENTIFKVYAPKNSYVVHISAPYVHLQGITITNTGPGIYATGIKITAPHSTISHCIFQDTPIGIAVWSSYNTIENSCFYHCDDEGIVFLGTSLSACEKNTITSCLFQHNCDGIELQNSNDIQIADCSFQKNTHAGIDAIGLQNSAITVSNCDFRENHAFDIYDATHQAVVIEPSTGDSRNVLALQGIIQKIREVQGLRPWLYRISSLLEQYQVA